MLRRWLRVAVVVAVVVVVVVVAVVAAVDEKAKDNDVVRSRWLLLWLIVWMRLSTATIPSGGGKLKNRSFLKMFAGRTAW